MYNRKGLWAWEQEMLERYFPAGARVLVASAGGGREMLALHRLGYEPDGFECNDRLRTFANDFLCGEGLLVTIHPASRDSCPAGLGLYDAAVVGWGAYML